LYECYKQVKQPVKALQMHEHFIRTKDSLQNKDHQRELIRQEFKYTYQKQALEDSLHFAKKQELLASELKLKQQQSSFLISGLLLAILFALFAYNRFRITKKQNAIIANQKEIVEQEKAKSDNLLLNILPENTANELKDKGTVAARSYSEASILFTDFIGFSQVAESMKPEALLEQLNHCFTAFDDIMTRYNLEKIKTIGDAYMAVSGLPSANKNHASDTVEAALAISQFMRNYVKTRRSNHETYFDCRIGVNTGPLVAGVVGTKKFQYDVWGDAVNIASRMESQGEAGKVNISEATFQAVKDDPRYHFEDRGVIRVKGNRNLKMYFVSHKTHNFL